MKTRVSIEEQIARQAAEKIGNGNAAKVVWVTEIILAAIKRAVAIEREMVIEGTTTAQRARRNVEHSASHQAGAASRELLKEIDDALAKIGV